MKDLPPYDPHACLAKLVERRIANEDDCAMYKGPESLKESDASNFVVRVAGGGLFCRVSREAIEHGVPDDDTLFEESLVGGIEDDFGKEI